MTSSFACTLCKSASEIIIQGSTAESTKCKCTNIKCGLRFTAADSMGLARVETKDDPRREEDAPTSEELAFRREVQPDPATSTSNQQRHQTPLPRTLAFVVVSKDRKRHEFCNRKQLKKVIFQWETLGTNYEVFELTPKAVTAKVDIT